MTDDTWKIGKLKVYLRTEFEIKDLGALKYILGIEVADPKTVFILQPEYMFDLPEET